MKMKFLAIFLVLLCCLMGAASAAEDISTDAVDDAIDDVVFIDEAVDADLQADDTVSSEPVDADSDVDQSDATIEADDEEGNTRASGTATASDWTTLRNKAQEPGTDYTITLTNNITIGSDDIIFGNNAIIDGNGKIISGNIGDTRIPFKSSNSALSITFKNIKFQNINCQMLIQLETSGISKLENCTFINIDTGDDHDSVVYNNLGTMNMTKCTFVNCSTGYGAVTNYRSGTTTGVTLNVKNCTFENNTAIYEPGAINNCGQLYVWDSIFNYNHAGWWAGAIHTHTNAKTVIRNCSFNGNTAGWNGGALYTYSDLEVYDSNFTNNNCSTNNGGGAIGASNYFFASKAYNVTVNNCRFIDNNNLHSNGYGGAIAAMNGGTLYVNGSTFIHNAAKKGQAIAGFNTNQYSNISEGNAHLVITNNMFINHIKYTVNTVLITGTYYTFENNTFVNSPQTAYTGSGNVYNAPSSSPAKSQGNLLGASYQETLGVEKYLNDGDDLDAAITEIEYDQERDGGTIHLADGKYSVSDSQKTLLREDISIIGNGESTVIENLMMSRSEIMNMENVENGGGTLTWINVTFTSPISLTGINNRFIDCTFNSAIDLEKDTGEYFKTLEYDADIDGYWNGIQLFDYAFENCNFINYMSDYVVQGYRFANITISNCDFKNITVDNVIETSCDKGFIFVEEGWDFIARIGGPSPKAMLKDSSFENTNVKAIIKAITTSADFVTVENNDYDFAKVQEKSVVDDYTYFDVPVSADTTISITNESKVVIITLTAEGKPIAGATVNYAIGDNQKSDVTDSNGQIKVTKVPDEFEIKVNFAGSNYYNLAEESKVFNFTVPADDNSTDDTNGSNSTPVPPAKVATKLTAPKVTATYNVAKKLVITLNANGKALANKKVTVKVGTISKTLTTNSKGQVSLNVATLVPKTYTATVKFAGDSSYSASTVKPKVVVNKAKVKLAAKAKTFKVKAKVKKYTATLKNNKGKVMKNTKLTLKIGKKTYTAKTNKKGVATFKVKLIKKGKNTATLKFAGNKYFKALSKKVKITVKK